MNLLRNVVRGSRSVARASGKQVCVRFEKCVYGFYRVSYTHNFLYYHTLSSMCVMCVLCVRIFKLYLELLKNSFLFFKLKFNLKLLYTQYTHL